MVGQLFALIIAAASFEGEVTAGSPFCALDARVVVSERLTLGAHLDLAGDFAAFRALAVGRLRLVDALHLTVGIGRAIAFRGEDTWEADLGLDATIPLDDVTAARLGAHALGYLGDDPQARGVIFLGRVGVQVRIADPMQLILDLGWMASADLDRPYGAIGVAF